MHFKMGTDIIILLASGFVLFVLILLLLIDSFVGG